MMEKPERKKVTLVTGSTSGIGLAIASRFAAEGYCVALNSFEAESDVGGVLDQVVAQSAGRDGGAVAYFEADLAVTGSGATLVRDVIERFGRIDVLVNNAGVQRVAPITDLAPEDWQRVRAISLDAAFDTIRTALPDMQGRNWGRIINIASAHGLVASPFKSAYVAAKHALVGLSKTVALEVAQKGITVNAICPGYVLTPLVEKQLADQARVHNMSPEQVKRQIMLAQQPTKQFITTAEVAALALYLCSDMARSITGAAIAIDGGWTAQ